MGVVFVSQVEPTTLRTGVDDLTTSTQQMADDAAGSKASFDTQQAAYGRLQVRAPARNLSQ
jgi:hypothetical protein